MVVEAPDTCYALFQHKTFPCFQKTMLNQQQIARQLQCFTQTSNCIPPEALRSNTETTNGDLWHNFRARVTIFRQINCKATCRSANSMHRSENFIKLSHGILLLGQVVAVLTYIMLTVWSNPQSFVSNYYLRNLPGNDV